MIKHLILLLKIQNVIIINIILFTRGLAPMIYQVFHKTMSGIGIQNENISNRKLAEELHKQIIRKFEKIKAQ